MPPRRTRPPARPVTIELDGSRVVADADASIASALVGDGHLLLARSPKFHRPRGPSCLRGGCDGCLMRVDGVPNVMTCLRTPEEGTRVERQNVILSAKLDLLRATDWFFPNGMNHHEMFAGIPGVQQVVQSFARRVSGLGELPEAPAKALRADVPSVATDALVVGGGPAGLLAAIALAKRGARVVLVEDHHAIGGSLLSFPRGARVAGEDVDATLAHLLEEAERASIELRPSCTVVGVLEGDDWLVDHPRDGLFRVVAPVRVIATGAHDPTPEFEGNDLPGVLSARAAGRLLRDGVLVGDRIVLVGDSPHARAFEEAARAEGARVERAPRIASVRGLSRVRSVVVRDDGGRASHVQADAVVFDAPRAPSFELAAEAGASVRHEPRGYVVATDAEGRAAARTFAIGEVAAREPFPGLDALRGAADRIAAAHRANREEARP